MGSPRIAASRSNGKLFKRDDRPPNSCRCRIRSAAAVMPIVERTSPDLLGTTDASLEYVRNGKLRELAGQSSGAWMRADIRCGRFVPGTRRVNGYGIGAHGNPPVEVIESSTRRQMPASRFPPQVKARLDDLAASAR